MYAPHTQAYGGMDKLQKYISHSTQVSKMTKLFNGCTPCLRYVRACASVCKFNKYL